MDVLLMRFDAPLMSFGAPMTDSKGVIQSFPGLSMVVGLFGNALGWHHRDSALLTALQRDLSVAARRDRAGSKLRDFQTVDLGQDFLLDDRAWTTRGGIEKRGGGNSKSTHIRERDYWAGAIYTLAVGLAREEDVGLTIHDLEHALRFPARPLFLGRKACLPASEISLGVVASAGLKQALIEAPLHPLAPTPLCEMWWPVDSEVHGANLRSMLVSDQRDWRNQIHTGQRWIAHGVVEVGGSS